MSSDNASSAVTYTSISSDSNGLSWGIPLVNAGELPEMNPYEEVAQQGQAHPLLPVYVPDPMELDEHVPLYVLEPEHPEYHVPSDDDIQVEDHPYADDASPTAESPGYIDPREEHEPEDDDDDDDDTDDEDEEPTEDEEEEQHIAPADSSAIPVVDPVPSAGDTEAFETDESAPTPGSHQTKVLFSQTRLRREQKTVRLEPPMSASIEARIAKHAAAPIPPTSPAYDQAPLGHRAAMIRIRDDIPEEDMPPQRRFILTAPPPGCDVAESSVAVARPLRGQYDFVDTVEARQGLIRSPGHDARTVARAADRAEDVGYVRALQASKHRMMTSIEEVNLRVSYQAQVRRQKSKDFYTQLHDARTDRRDIRLEIDVVRGHRIAYETKLHEVRQACLSYEAQNRALLTRLETLETHMSRMEWQRQRAEDDEVSQIMRTQDDASHNSGGELRRPMQTECVCSYTDFMKCQPLNFKGTEGVVGLSQWLKKMESVFHISGCANDNQVKFTTCTLLGAALTWWNGHVRTLGYDAAYAMTWGTLKIKLTDKYCPKASLADETEKVDKYINGLPDNIHGNVMFARPKTLDDAIELAITARIRNFHTYAEKRNIKYFRFTSLTRDSRIEVGRKENQHGFRHDLPRRANGYEHHLVSRLIVLQKSSSLPYHMRENDTMERLMNLYMIGKLVTRHGVPVYYL
ncbi:hypothetical protein Tco_0200469 [Tanacetum coccineum]